VGCLTSPRIRQKIANATENAVLRASSGPYRRVCFSTERRLHVHVLDADQLRFVTCRTGCCGPMRQLPEHGSDAWRRFGHPQDMDTGGHPDRGVCAAVDVHYLRTGGARAAAVLAADAAFAHVLAEHTAVLPRVAPYRPGEFYLRELPPLRAVLEDLSGLALLVVDGYADLDPAGRPGLGAHAHAEFGIPVIGVAKSQFRTATHALPVLRGSSERPLFVTAAGMPAADAADLVRRMAGRYRLPDALRRADTLARTGPPAATMTDRQPDLPTDAGNAVM
jgi:deoxyribonuclease V